MAYKLLITDKAENDLDDIFTYIAHVLCNAQAAMQLADEIENRYRLLMENPKLYGTCQQPLLKRHHYRKVVIDGYLMIYRVDDEKNTIYVERFFSRLQDYADKL